jgi:hypothetical protein
MTRTWILILAGWPASKKSVQGGENGKNEVGVFIFQKRGNLIELYCTNPIALYSRGGKKHEPRGRKDQEFVMVGRFNRTTHFGNCRGFIITVSILLGSFLSSLSLQRTREH